ncbi:MAG: UDP-2,3-diacylglucosamine diphosphatase, partial [Flavobacteriales bacterium]|nr:UDP-2,3-diacylglucosamine diphosphatase [Flavobacteriales bacterium]
SKRIKNNVKSAVSFINHFEDLVVDLAAENDYRFVVCGHIHQPLIKEVNRDGKKVTYLNSGDWVESLTALEYNKGLWNLYKHEDAMELHGEFELELEQDFSNEALFQNLVSEFKMLAR